VKIGVYGGAFNPVHIGHIRVAWGVKDALGLDKVLFVPAGLAPHKEIEGATPNQRYELVALSIKGTEWMDISDIEIKDSKIKAGPIASIDTLKKLEIKYTGDDLCFIIGSDEAAVIDTWKKPAELLAMCKFIVVKRPGFAIKKVNSEYLSKMKFVDIETLDVSSKNIRYRINHKLYFKHLVPAEAYNYIKEKELYIQQQ
jgi:nicotinate-nucleotide adenylyltransferase